MKKKDKILMKYHCGFCGSYFEKEVATSGNGGKHKRVNSQVMCLCGNFVKTW